MGLISQRRPTRLGSEGHPGCYSEIRQSLEHYQGKNVIVAWATVKNREFVLNNSISK